MIAYIRIMHTFSTICIRVTVVTYMWCKSCARYKVSIDKDNSLAVVQQLCQVHSVTNIRIFEYFLPRIFVCIIFVSKFHIRHTMICLQQATIAQSIKL